jgi:tRNA-modifying protein YgfZ
MALLLDTAAVHTRPAGVVRASGHDRLAYLHSLLSQHVEDAQPGHCADFLYLDHKANPLAEGRAVVRAGEVLLVVPPPVAAPFGEALDRFRFLMDVTVEVLDDWSVASIRGPQEIRVPGMRSEPMTAAPHGPGMVVHDRSGGADLLGPASWVQERADELALPAAGDEDWRRWVVTRGVPTWGHEISEGRRPQELGLLPTHVHLRKGCYPGQETIAKTWNLGRPRRALARVRFAAPVTAGAVVDAAGRSGVVTSAATDAAGEGCAALALLPVDREGHLPELVTADGIKGVVEGRVGEGLVPPGA